MTMTTRYPILRDLATRGFDTGRECRDALTEIDKLRDDNRTLRHLVADTSDEIGRLRAQLIAPRSLCGECGGFLVLRCGDCGTVHGDTTRCDGEDCADPIYADDGTHSPLCCIRVADENDQLRRLNGRLERDFADMNNARRNLDTGKVRFCDATHPDTECAGWLWYCSLIAGHLGPHHCAGAAW